MADESELKRQLTDRFVKGIRKSFTPCPLIGPKWLQEFPNGRPADFRFFGVRKLAKAIGFPPAKIIKILMRNVSLRGLEVDVEIKGDVLIDLYRRDKPRAEKRKKNKPAPQNRSKGPAGKQSPAEQPRRERPWRQRQNHPQTNPADGHNGGQS
jgi:hypothetical protein